MDRVFLSMSSLCKHRLVKFAFVFAVRPESIACYFDHLWISFNTFYTKKGEYLNNTQNQTLTSCRVFTKQKMLTITIMVEGLGLLTHINTRFQCFPKFTCNKQTVSFKNHALYSYILKLYFYYHRGTCM